MHRIAAVALGVGAGALLGLVAGPWFAVGGLVVAIGYERLLTQRYRQRQRLLAEPMIAEERAQLERSVPYYRKLDDEGRRRFEDDVRIFLAEQVITGAGGRSVDREAKLLIAASAAMLTHGLPDWEWSRVRDIVVYPRAFDERYDTEKEGNVAGQVHLRGPVIFSRRELHHGFRDAGDGLHVGLHELAHVIDMEDGSADGLPADLDWMATAPWVKTVASRLRRVRARQGSGRRDVLRPYAGTNEAELFAVAVEAFFERPGRLARLDPELFALLRDYFNQDPRQPGQPLPSSRERES